jgi:hypothetical protein
VLKKLLEKLLPARLDESLYAMSAAEALRLENPDLEIRHHTIHNPTGIPSLDRRLSRSKECYLVTIDGQMAHLSWLHWSVRLPRQCGFDGTVPVIGDCHTFERFRGKAIYPRVLRYIARDVAARAAATSVYVLVSPSNLSSVRGIEKAGFRRLARLRGIRFAGLLLGRQVERLP